jgi:transposase-like protein
MLPSRIKAAACDYCGSHVHPTAGTIFHKSRTKMRTWFHAIYLMSTTRCGISAMQLMRETNVGYKTAWRMFTQIRKLLAESIDDLGGDIESDETYIGGKRKGKQFRGGRGKIVVHGAVERQGRVVPTVIQKNSTPAVLGALQTKMLPETMIFTDEALQYNRLEPLGYKHKRVNHLAKVYVDGDAHTNTIEGFWSLLKRGISGVYHAVSQKHLQGYLNEYAFRYNHRRDSHPMFESLMRQHWSTQASQNQPRLGDETPS